MVCKGSTITAPKWNKGRGYQIDLSMAVVKEIEASWLTALYGKLLNEKETVTHGFEIVGMDLKYRISLVRMRPLLHCALEYKTTNASRPT